jgi:hypothetical protein
MFLLNTEPWTSLSYPLTAVFQVLRGPGPQDAETTLAFATVIFLNYL